METATCLRCGSSRWKNAVSWLVDYVVEAEGLDQAKIDRDAIAAKFNALATKMFDEALKAKGVVTK